MKIVIWSFLALFLIVAAIGGLLSAAHGHDAPSVIRGLVASAWFSWGAWVSWKRASRPRNTEIAPIQEPHQRLWRRR
ncbi:hypothetical protein OG410_13960 [Streptomyces sp. NBC_00659]|uniref:hypothetical protein n=1 Tax=Streptomyces sp. NBC_00659 TaxID=2903669 RepID=UPI002E36EB44|nr:hypothetical protein [Streptomyces sp. NBC_00659]